MSNPESAALRVAYLNIVQGIISRLANSSSVIKGASVTVLSALLAFAGGEHVTFHVWMFILPGVIFMCYHAYFLQQERAFVNLYNAAAAKPLSTEVSFVIDAAKINAVKEAYWSVLARKTIWGFHLPMIAGFVLAFWLSPRG
ncbi:hypothetical protein [Pseudomonas syringae]|uniref:hypothetical protein n=1 Tax=Pseudomonas syringae TaxID=317 RepID=UPI001BCA7C66|nr:hypothetical protein [Pseudomonas syringae]QVK32286.1 hypothetical protein KIJ28_25085 [Pseudomonas syringae]